jgi:hypothetical protein
MTGPEIDRRAALGLGGAALLVPAVASAGATRPASGIMLFDPASAEARAMAKDARGQRLIPLKGDPVRFWRDSLADVAGPIGGITSWSDYVMLRGLAAEQGLRVRSEEHIAVAGKPMLVRWTAA